MLHGENLILQYHDGTGWVAFAAAKTCKYEIQTDTLETAEKQSATWKTYIQGKSSWTLTTDGLAKSASSSVNILNLMLSRSRLYVRVKTDNNVKRGYGYLTKLSVSSSSKKIVTYSITIKGTGTLSEPD